ncbi:MAG: hypothetical protein KC910_25795, partial [Candidatus Eremiobacteraeota bacterium]|nr:hypothetical protein [Candidatus Eremiobacteraeota bacterium]
MRLDGLLAQLSQAGRLDSRGHFTLSPALATSKSRRYQLTDPHGWVLELAAFALRWGGTALKLESTREGCRLTFDGPLLGNQELELVRLKLRLGELAGRRGALAHLAVGLNSALGLARRIEVMAGSKRWLFYPDGRERRYSVDPPQGNSIRMVASNFWGVARGADRETALLSRRCSLAPLTLEVDGERLSPPSLDGWIWRGREPVPSLPAAEPAGEAGEASLWMRPRPGPPLLRPVVAGVEFPGKTVAGWPDLDVVAWDRRLVTNVSHSEVVEDERYRRLLGEVEALFPALACKLAEEFEREPDPERAWWLADWLAGRPGPAVEAPLLGLALLRRTDGGALCLQELLDYQAQHGQVLVCSHTSAVRPLDNEPIVLIDEIANRLLPAFFDRRVSGEPVLLEAERAARNRTRWSSSPQLEPKLGSEVVSKLPLDPFAGEVGLLRQGLSRSITVLKSGRWLEELVGEFPEGVVVVADHPDFAPKRCWDGVEPDHLLARLFQAVHEALPYLFEQCPRPDLLPAYERYRERYQSGFSETRHLGLETFASRCQAWSWWRSGVLAYGSPLDPPGAYLYRGPGVPPQPLALALPAGYAALLLEPVEAGPDPDLLAALVVALEHPQMAAISYLEELHRLGLREVAPAVAECLTFEAHPGSVSLAGLLADIERLGWVSYAYPEEAVESPPEPARVVILTAHQARVLADLFGRRQIRHDPHLAQRLRSEASFLARDLFREPPVAPGAIRAPARKLAGSIVLEPDSEQPL